MHTAPARQKLTSLQLGTRPAQAAIQADPNLARKAFVFEGLRILAKATDPGTSRFSPPPAKAAGAAVKRLESVYGTDLAGIPQANKDAFITAAKRAAREWNRKNGGDSQSGRSLTELLSQLQTRLAR